MLFWLSMAMYGDASFRGQVIQAWSRTCFHQFSLCCLQSSFHSAIAVWSMTVASMGSALDSGGASLIGAMAASSGTRFDPQVFVTLSVKIAQSKSCRQKCTLQNQAKHICSIQFVKWAQTKLYKQHNMFALFTGQPKSILKLQSEQY